MELAVFKVQHGVSPLDQLVLKSGVDHGFFFHEPVNDPMENSLRHLWPPIVEALVEAVDVPVLVEDSREQQLLFLIYGYVLGVREDLHLFSRRKPAQVQFQDIKDLCKFDRIKLFAHDYVLLDCPALEVLIVDRQIANLPVQVELPFGENSLARNGEHEKAHPRARSPYHTDLTALLDVR